MTPWHFVLARARVTDTVVAAVAVFLGLLCLTPLFETQTWLVPAVVMVAVVAALGAGSRAIGMPLPLIPIVELIGVLGLLTVLFASDAAWAGLVPSGESWDALRELTRIGMIDASALAAPVPAIEPIVLLAVGGAGLAALSVDVLFVSVRSPLLAGIPLLTLFLGSALMQFGRAPWWLFPPAALGWLLILAADQRDRIREWSDAPPTARIRGLSSVARRTGAVAIVAAMLVALVLPVRGIAPWRDSGAGKNAGAGGRPAGGPVVLDPLVSMRRGLVLAEDVQVLRYTTANPDPPYLRVTALEAFDGTTWSPRRDLADGRSQGIPLPGSILDRLPTVNPTYRVRGGTSFTYDITVKSLQNAYLPLPYPISTMSKATGLGDKWSLDADTGVAFSAGAPATGLKYEVVGLDPGIKPADLRRATSRDGSLFPQLGVPGGLPPEVRRLAKQVTADASTPYDKALALQQWFTRDGGFRYSTSVRSGADADYLAEFLRDRVGYCEQFASSMALMARTLGIPARVVVGFTQGSKVGANTWEVTVRDAHAWPELWFDDIGWVRFEPTPRSGGTVQAPTYAPAPYAAQSAQGEDPRGVRDPAVLPSVVVDGPAQTRGTALLVGGLVAAVVIGCLLVWPAGRRVVRRRRRLHGGDYDHVVLGAWEEIGDTAIDVGREWSAAHTPRQAARRLAAGMSEPAVEALHRIRVQVEQMRYAPRHAASAAGAERAAAVRADVKVVVADLRDRVQWRTRLASYCWPPSARRRQRSSSRSMNPGDLREGADGLVGAASSVGRTWKDE